MPRGCGDGGQDERHEGFARRIHDQERFVAVQYGGQHDDRRREVLPELRRGHFHRQRDGGHPQLQDRRQYGHPHGRHPCRRRSRGVVRQLRGCRQCDQVDDDVQLRRPVGRRSQTAADQQLYVQQQQGVGRSSLYLRLRRHGRQDQCADQQHHDFGQQRQSRACDPKRRRYLRPRKRQPGDRQFDGLRQPFRKGRRYRGLRQGGQAEQGGDRQLYDCRQHDGDGRKRCGIAAGCRRRGHRGLQYADLGQYDGRRGRRCRLVQGRQLQGRQLHYRRHGLQCRRYGCRRRGVRSCLDAQPAGRQRRCDEDLRAARRRASTACPLRS